MPLDIGIGVLLALLIHSVFHIPLTLWMVLLGIAATLLPDIDILTALFGRWRHRELTHYPLTYAPVIIVAFVALPLPYACLITAGIVAHFIHDTIGTGWGISWLWPFSTRRYLVYPDGERRKGMGTFATWLPNEHPEWSHQGAHDWVRTTYFRLSTTAFIEYGLLVIAALTLLFYIW